MNTLQACPVLLQGQRLSQVSDYTDDSNWPQTHSRISELVKLSKNCVLSTSKCSFCYPNSPEAQTRCCKVHSNDNFALSKRWFLLHTIRLTICFLCISILNQILNWKSLNCSAHCLKLCLQLYKVSRIEWMVAHGKKLARHFRHSIVVISLARPYQLL